MAKDLLAPENQIASGPRDLLAGELGGAHMGHRIGAFTDGMAQALTFGTSDEIAAGLNTGVGLWGDYGEALNAQRSRMNENREKARWSSLAGELGGALTGGWGLARKGLTFLRPGQGLGKAVVAGGGDGLVHGALHGAGRGEGLEDRIAGAGAGAVTGAAVGGAVPAISSAVKAGANAAGSTLNLGSRGRANRAIDSLVQRSGKSAEEIEAALRSAQKDEVAEFVFADALGDPGARSLNGLVRSNNDGSHVARDFLVSRQLTQGQRIGRALSEGLEANQTKRDFKAGKKLERGRLADEEFAAAAAQAGPVDPRNVSQHIDNVANIRHYQEAGLTPDRLTKLIASKRPQLVNEADTVWLSSGPQVYAVRKSINDEASAAFSSGRMNEYRELKRIVDLLDDALEQASPHYTTARQNYSRRSDVIDAVDAGADATASMQRSDDVLADFAKLSPEEQQAFRLGYNDKLQARIDARSLSPSTNKMQPLLSGKFAAELPAIAPPSKRDALARQLLREQDMWETSHRALSGSRTADNLEDINNLRNFDPSLIEALLRGDVRDVAGSAVRGTVNMSRGYDPRTRELIGEALMSNDPIVVRQRIQEALIRGERSARRRAATTAALSGTAGANTPINRAYPHKSILQLM